MWWTKPSQNNTTGRGNFFWCQKGHIILRHDIPKFIDIWNKENLYSSYHLALSTAHCTLYHCIILYHCINVCITLITCHFITYTDTVYLSILQIRNYYYLYCYLLSLITDHYHLSLITDHLFIIYHLSLLTYRWSLITHPVPSIFSQIYYIIILNYILL